MKSPTDNIRIEPATERDVPLVLAFIRELAEYERLAHEVVATENRLRETLFGARPAAEVVIAHDGDRPAGFALYFANYSTFLARPGLYLSETTDGSFRSCFRNLDCVNKGSSAGRKAGMM